MEKHTLQTLLFEEPWIIGCIGGLTGGLALLVWTQTGVRAALHTGLTLLIATLVAIAINVQVETDRERIRNVLHEVARLLEAN
ncbi:MAG: hypothetical protein D6753_15760, partial [Planctomycetota bacterium]